MTKSKPLCHASALTTVFAMTLIAACSSTPPAGGNARTASIPSSSVSSASSQGSTAPASPAAVAAPASSNTTSQKSGAAPLTAEKVLALQKQGYQIVDRDGETYYCRKDKKTGSQLVRETVCLTAAQADSLRDQTQRSLGNMARQVAPPAGK